MTFFENSMLSGEDRINSLGKSYADVGCSSLGPDYFWRYVYAVGNTNGFGKTYEKCFTQCLKDRGIKAIEGGSKTPVDTIDFSNRVLLQTKISKEFPSNLNIARVELIKGNNKKEILENKIQDYKNRMIKQFVLHECSEVILVLAITNDKKVYVYHLATWDGQNLITRGNFLSENSTTYSENHTPLWVSLSGLKLIYKKDYPSPEQLSFKMDQVSNNRKDLSKLSDKELLQVISNTIDEANKFVHELESYCLGKNFGDKGEAFQAIVIKKLSLNFTGFNSESIGFADFFIPNKVAVQLKRNETRVSEFVFCRSSKHEEIQELPELDCSTFFSESVAPLSKQTNKKKIQKIRIEDVSNRVEKTLNDTKTDRLILFSYNAPIHHTTCYLLSEKVNGKMVHRGSFLKDGFVKSVGGEHGNQTHFRIKKMGLQPISLVAPLDSYCE